MQLSYMLQMAVIVVTALGGTAFGVSVFLLWFSIGRDPQFVNTSVLYAAASGLVTLIGVIILIYSKPPPEDRESEPRLA
jgi:hypothetical protein